MSNPVRFDANERREQRRKETYRIGGQEFHRVQRTPDVERAVAKINRQMDRHVAEAGVLEKRAEAIEDLNERDGILAEADEQILQQTNRAFEMCALLLYGENEEHPTADFLAEHVDSEDVSDLIRALTDEKVEDPTPTPTNGASGT